MKLKGLLARNEIERKLNYITGELYNLTIQGSVGLDILMFVVGNLVIFNINYSMVIFNINYSMVTI